MSPYYDAMLAKVIAWAPTRQAAIERLNRGLEETDVRGIVTNIPFLSALVTHPEVRANTIDTGFIERELKEPDRDLAGASGDLELCAAVAAIIVDEQQAARSEAHSPWQTVRLACRSAGGKRVFQFRQGQGAEQKVTLHYGDGPIDACRSASANSSFAIIADGWRQLRPDASTA